MWPPQKVFFFLRKESLELTAASKRPLTHVFSKYPLLTRHLPLIQFCISYRLSKRSIHLTLSFISYRLSTRYIQSPLTRAKRHAQLAPYSLFQTVYMAQKAMLSCISFTISTRHKKLMLPCMCFRLSKRSIHCRTSILFTWNLQLPLYCTSFWRATQHVSYHCLNPLAPEFFLKF
jgi:hypothetical protein